MNKTPVELLKTIAASIGLGNISNEVLDNPSFALWSGSSIQKQHHYGKGGLAQHTLEVVELSLLNNEYFKTLDKGANKYELFLAALFHDVGKIWDYTPKKNYEEWYSSTHKRQIHHISRSGLVWHDAAIKHNIDNVLHDAVLHAILSHHGLREWGSPVAPSNRAAWILHLSDAMSARVDDCLRNDRFSH